MLAAQVIGASADPASHTLFLNRGDRDHVRRNQPVITPDGVVGKIVEVFPATSQVLLINDKDSGAGALMADSRTHGVVKGSGDPDPRLDYVANDDPVHAGEMILTSGEDRIFPKDLLIGTVVTATPGITFQVIHVRPAAHLDRLEDVLILLTPQELKKANESADATGSTSDAPGIVQKESAPPSSPAPASGNTTAPKSSHPPVSAAAPKTPSASPNAQSPASAPPAPQN